jgi:hypothetical protein
MQKSELKLDNGNTVFIFDPNAEFQGKTFVSLSKSVRGFQGKKGKFQVISIGAKHRDEVLVWLRKCLTN